jgi:hypothetical protein
MNTAKTIFDMGTTNFIEKANTELENKKNTAKQTATLAIADQFGLKNLQKIEKLKTKYQNEREKTFNQLFQIFGTVSQKL